MKKSIYSLAALGILASASLHSFAAPISISEIVNVTGDTDTNSQISDGLADAFDGYGQLENLNGLSVLRQVDTLEADFTYRFYEQFTNNTMSQISTTVTFGGNLGSDGNENIARSDDFSHVTFEDRNNDGIPDQNTTPSTNCCSNDPVLSFVFGNNAWTANNISIRDTSNDFDIAFNLVLDPGETLSMLFFAGLFLDQTDRTGDVTRALNYADTLIITPLTSGLSAQQLAGVVNFSQVSAPSTLAILSLGMIGLGVRRFKK